MCLHDCTLFRRQFLRLMQNTIRHRNLSNVVKHGRPRNFTICALDILAAHAQCRFADPNKRFTMSDILRRCPPVSKSRNSIISHRHWSWRSYSPCSLSILVVCITAPSSPANYLKVSLYGVREIYAYCSLYRYGLLARLKPTASVTTTPFFEEEQWMTSFGVPSLFTDKTIPT